MAASVIAKACQLPRLLTLDMGGTSTDVSLIDHQVKYTSDARIAEFPLAISLLDIHTIGAGGGSIARVDEAGGLHVGPESAGATPGPACYDHGGLEATITDANVVIGRLPVEVPWASGLQLNKHAAEQAVNRLAEKLGCSVTQAAHGIIDLANAHMAQALRVISIHRGYDPSKFSLFPFGGAGGLHMCAVAQQLGMVHILVPRNAGILSAQGMLYAPIGQMSSRSVCQRWDEITLDDITNKFEELVIDAETLLMQSGKTAERIEYWLECRYQGQSSTIRLVWDQDHDIPTEFERAHQQRYGFSLSGHAIELVTLRVWVYQDVAQPEFESIHHQQSAEAIDYCQVVGEPKPVPVFLRADLASGQFIQGPCVILDDSGTLYIESFWQGTVTQHGHIHLQMTTDCP
jgi:N-methylhydantoinase A